LAQQSPCCQSFDENLIFWAMRNLPAVEAVKHFLICGATGSGKTVAIKLFLQSIAPRFLAHSGRAEQLILFDFKGDALPMLASMGLRFEDGNVWLLNPGDERGARWNLGEAAFTPALARRLATLLVPEEPRSNAPFWADGARELTYATIQALNQLCGTRWTFRDLLCALSSGERIQAVTGRHEPAERVAQPFLEDPLHNKGLLSTLATKVGRFDQVAALWHSSRSGRQFSIPEFLQRPGVLVLSNDPVLKDSFWAINALLLNALTQEILRQPDTRQPRHWFVLDEFPAMKNVDCIPDLIAAGRSKGASVLLGIQGIEAVTHTYGQDLANAILSQCAYKTFLRAGGPLTAEWAERFFGRVRRVDSSYSESWQRGERSHSIQYRLEDRSLFNASFFGDLPFPAPGEWYAAVNDVPCFHTTLVTRRPFDQVLALSRPAVAVPGTIHRDQREDQTLWPWTKEEEAVYCGKSGGVEQEERGAQDAGQGKVKARRSRAQPERSEPAPGGIAARRRKRTGRRDGDGGAQLNGEG
jgi:type IV secretory pathway TraG/TraD family ATPase VirD4